jgi:hypothetical protein
MSSGVDRPTNFIRGSGVVAADVSLLSYTELEYIIADLRSHNSRPGIYSLPTAPGAGLCAPSVKLRSA